MNVDIVIAKCDITVELNVILGPWFNLVGIKIGLDSIL